MGSLRVRHDWLTEHSMVTKKERGKRDKEYGINRYTLLYVKEISNKDLLYSTKNYIQYRIKLQWKIHHFPGSLTSIKSYIMGYWSTINKLCYPTLFSVLWFSNLRVCFPGNSIYGPYAFLVPKVTCQLTPTATLVYSPFLPQQVSHFPC